MSRTLVVQLLLAREGQPDDKIHVGLADILLRVSSPALPNRYIIINADTPRATPIVGESKHIVDMASQVLRAVGKELIVQLEIFEGGDVPGWKLNEPFVLAREPLRDEAVIGYD